MENKWGPFEVSSGVKQGILSLAPFNPCMDYLSTLLKVCQTGCTVVIFCWTSLCLQVLVWSFVRVALASCSSFLFALWNMIYTANKSVIMICRTKEEMDPDFNLPDNNLSVCNKIQFLVYFIQWQMMRIFTGNVSWSIHKQTISYMYVQMELGVSGIFASLYRTLVMRILLETGDGTVQVKCLCLL